MYIFYDFIYVITALMSILLKIYLVRAFYRLLRDNKSFNFFKN